MRSDHPAELPMNLGLDGPLDQVIRDALAGRVASSVKTEYSSTTSSVSINDPDEARRVLERMLGGGAALDLAPRRKPTSLSWVVVALICAAVGVVVGLLLA